MPSGNGSAQFSSSKMPSESKPSGSATSEGRPTAMSGMESGVAAGFSMASAAGYTIDDLDDGPFNWKLAIVATIAASAGSLFGYDLGLITTIASVPGFNAFSGEILLPPTPPPPSLEEASSKDSPFCRGEFGVGQILAFTLFGGGMIGAALGSFFCPRFGRRATLVYAAAIFGLGVVLQGLSANINMFYAARVIMGAGVGMTNQVTPIYLAEISPANNRGAIGISFQFFITFGILFATLVSFMFEQIYIRDEHFTVTGESHAWRFPVLIGLLPSMVVMFGALCLTDTPQYMMGSKKEDAKALSYYLLSQLRQNEDVTREYNRMTLYCDRRYTCLESWQILFLDRRHIPPLLVTTALTVLQQFTFLNGFLLFLPDLFAIGLTTLEPTTARLLSSVTNQIVNFLATTIAIYIADRFGRRPLFMEAGVQLFLAACVMYGLFFEYDGAAQQDLVQVFISIVVIEVYVSAYAWSWGPLPWTMPAELNAWPWRSAGTSFSVIVNFAASMLVAGIFNSLFCLLQYWFFILIAVIALLATALAYLLIPETRDIDLNETEFLFKGHWFWRRFYPEDERIEVLTRPGCSCCYKDSNAAELAHLAGSALQVSGSPAAVPDYTSFTTAVPPPGLMSSIQRMSYPTLTDMYGVPESVRGELTLTRSKLNMSITSRARSSFSQKDTPGTSSKDGETPMDGSPGLTPSSSGAVPIGKFDSRNSLQSSTIPE